jgi:hypothetical protein
MAALAAYVILDNNGTVVKCHNGGGATPGVPTSGPGDLESLINAGWLQKREVALDGGRVLIVLEKP